MSEPSEIDLYRDNVPHGSMVIGYGDWSSSQDTISVSPGAGYVIHVDVVDFIVDDAMSIDVGSIVISGGGFSQTITSADGLWKLLALADKRTLQRVTLDGTNYVYMGEIRMFPPESVSGTNTFSIAGSTLTLTPGAVGPYFTIRGWKDTS